MYYPLDLKAARVEEVEYQKYLLENTGFRDRLETELTEPVLRELFNKNLQFFKVILTFIEFLVRFTMVFYKDLSGQETIIFSLKMYYL